MPTDRTAPLRYRGHSRHKHRNISKQRSGKIRYLRRLRDSMTCPLTTASQRTGADRCAAPGLDRTRQHVNKFGYQSAGPWFDALNLVQSTGKNVAVNQAFVR